MAFGESIKLTIDVVTGGASSALKKLKADMADADGAFGKSKVAASGLFEALPQMAGAAALGAGTALVGFGVKAIGAFQDTALGAASLRDSLGVTAEEASRLQEVAGDLGIGVGSLESAIGKMNIAVDKTPAKFDELGAAIVRNKDGTVNVNETFLSTIDALNKIPDATARANAAQQVFGKGWKDISELVTTGADGVREAMASVESSKIIDDNEIEQARKFRDMMDQLKGVMESVTIAAGGALVENLNEIGDAVQELEGPFRTLQGVLEDLDNVPVVGGPIVDGLENVVLPGHAAKEAVMGVVDAVNALTEAEDHPRAEFWEDTIRAAAGLEQATSWMDAFNWGADGAVNGRDAILGMISAAVRTPEELAKMREEMAADEAQAKLLKEANDGVIESITGMADAARDAAETQSEAEAATDDWNDTLATYNQQIADAAGDQSKLNEIQRTGTDRAVGLADATTAAFDAQSRANGVTLTASAKLDIWNGSMLTAARSADGPLRDSIVKYIATANGIPPEKVTEILANPDYAGIGRGEAALNHMSRTRAAYLDAELRGGSTVEQELARLSRQRFVTVTATTGGGNRQAAAMAGGGVVKPGQGVTLVGEEGPELVTMPAGSVVTPTNETINLARNLASSGTAGGGGTVNYFTIHAGLGTDETVVAREIQRMLDQQNRRNGRGR